MAYVTVAQMHSFLDVTQSTSDLELSDMIAAAQLQIDGVCRRHFEAPTDTTRSYSIENLVGDPRVPYYEGQFTGQVDRFEVSGVFGFGLYSQALLDLDEDLLSVTTLVNGDGTLIDPSNYYLWPLNQPPYQQIKLKSQVAWNLDTDTVIQVTGRFAYSLTADAGIQLATKKLVAYHFHQKDNQNYSTIQLPEGGIQIPPGFPNDVFQLLKQGRYIKPLGVIG